MEFIRDIAPFILVVALVLLIVVLVLVARVLRMTAMPESGAGIPFDPAAQSAPVDFRQIPASQRIYAIADQLSGAFNIAAHPEELSAEEPFQQGAALLAGAAISLKEVVRFAVGDHAIVSCMAFVAMRQRGDTADARREVVAGIGSLAPWAQYFALDYLAEKTPADERMIGPVLASMTMYMDNRLSRGALEDLIRHRHALGEPLEFGPDDTWFLNPDGMTALRMFLDRIDPELGEPLRESLGELAPAPGPGGLPPMFDAGDVLKSAGRFWTKRDAAKEGEIHAYPELEESIAEAWAMITAPQPQSVLLRGESGVGKTTLKRLLADRLVRDGWQVFAAGHGEIAAGQVYIGMLEERLKRIIERLRNDRKTVWFIPDIDRLAFTGTHRYSEFSVMDAILPHIVDGTLRIVADAEPAALDRLTRKQPRIASALAVLEVKPTDAGTALEIARRWVAGQGLKADDAVLHEAWELAQQYLSARAAPGNLMDLLKATRLKLAATASAGQSALTAEDVIATLARQTGLPEGLLDPKRDLDLDGLERALSARVMGQEEAVHCLVDRVAMMKAGLADPTRPYGVFLFAGPTGTGKTEIAKSLAAWLFGSADRLIRLDMSELQTADSFDRLLGSTGSAETESLADQIRRQPFSVILLDEFEKAHPNVWDLFLQIFDDARITDRQGRTASFRHAIIILTANLGATIPTGLSIGFGSGTRGFDVEEVEAAVARAFRREFINRLDRVIVFRPLDRELMRKILYRELREVTERRGLKRRPWAVEWDESAIAFLLEKGFTPDLGARPLRRAVERYLLSPLAAAIVRHQFPEGDQFLLISCAGDGLRVEFVDPDLDEGGEEEPDQAAAEAAAEEGVDLAKSVLLQPQGSPRTLAALQGLLEGIEAEIASEDWQRRRHGLFTQIDQADFWSSPGRFAALGLLETIDRIEKGAERARGLIGRIERHAGRDSLPRRLLALLAQNVYLLATARDDVTGERPREAFLLVEAQADGLHDTAEALGFARLVADMYEAWAKKRNMRLTRLFRSNPRGELEMRALYAVSGYGAYSILEGETGLHVRERAGETPRDHRRDTVRVTVVAQPDEPPPSSASQAAAFATRIVEKSGRQSVEVVRRYREAPSPLVRDLARGWRTGRLDLVLGGDFDLFR